MTTFRRHEDSGADFSTKGCFPLAIRSGGEFYLLPHNRWFVSRGNMRFNNYGGLGDRVVLVMKQSSLPGHSRRGCAGS